MLNWLVIGIGDITTKRVLPGILAEPYGVPAWNNVEDALEQSAADAVYVATPVFLHAPQSIRSLRAGKHVLCEKPMAMNYAEACSMEQAARESGRILGVAYDRRLYPISGSRHGADRKWRYRAPGLRRGHIA